MTDYSNPQQHRILILDFGAQYTQLIGRCIRELGVYCEIFPWGVEEARIAEFDPNGIILSGGPASTYDDETPMAPDSIFLMNLPLLGICYGMQTMVAQLGGQVENADHREFGAAEVSWEPMARCNNAATTEESTPPDNPRITSSSPT